MSGHRGRPSWAWQRRNLAIFWTTSLEHRLRQPRHWIGKRTWAYYSNVIGWLSSSITSAAAGQYTSPSRYSRTTFFDFILIVVSSLFFFFWFSPVGASLQFEFPPPSQTLPIRPASLLHRCGSTPLARPLYLRLRPEPTSRSSIDGRSRKRKRKIVQYSSFILI